MRSLFALLIFGLSTSANATLIQFDVRGGTLQSNTVNASLLFDTAGASVQFNRRDDPACFRSFGATLGGQILGISVDDTPVFSDISGVPGSASVGGEFREPACIPGEQFLAGGLSLSADTYQLDFFFRAVHAIPTADEVLATADPLATVLLSAQLEGSGDITLHTATGSLGFRVDELSIRDVTASVPEPPTLLLSLLSLAGLVISCNARRRSWSWGISRYAI